MYKEKALLWRLKIIKVSRGCRESEATKDELEVIHLIEEHRLVRSTSQQTT